jgi:hypothetical protein
MKRRIRLFALMLLSALFATGCGSSGKNDASQEIIVTELNGSATATAFNADAVWDISQGMRLSSQEWIRLKENADIILSIGEKKHLYADTGANFVLLSSGEKGALRIFLTEGAVIAGQDNKPSKKDPYQVATPNVLVTPLEKQTVYLVELGEEDGEPFTAVSVLNGSVRTGTSLGGTLREQELQQGEERKFAGDLPNLTESTGQTEDEVPAAEGAEENADVAEQSQEGNAEEPAKVNPEDRELIITKDGQSASLGKASDYTWGQRALVHIHNFFDRVGDRIDDVFTKRATERKIHGWLGLTSIPFTAGDKLLGQDGSDNIVIDKPGVVCLGGLEVGDSEEDMWHFLGFHIDQKMAEKGVFVKNGNASLELSTGGFTYTKDGMVAKVVIKNGEVAIIAMYFE